jgi:phenylalanyl-tRNA synthetase beta chain
MSLSPEEFAPRADVHDPATPWRKIYVGVLTQVTPHPHAEREVVVEVDAGWGRLTVVTGGPHVAVGRKVAVALPGARVVDAGSVIPRTRKLKKGRIRGVLSEGMLCSAKELGLSDDHSAIYVLAPEAPVGAPLADWLHGERERLAA